MREIRAHIHLNNHPNILLLRGLIIEQRWICSSITEWMVGGSLRQSLCNRKDVETQAVVSHLMQKYSGISSL